MKRNLLIDGLRKVSKVVLLLTFFNLILCSATQAINWTTVNDNWHFVKGNPENAQAIDFDDSGWESVSIPHEWAINGPFNEEEPGSTGKLPWKGEGWYRNTFKIDKSAEGKIIYFLFDGIMAMPKVYINGELAGQWDYGYNSFFLDCQWRSN